MTEWPDGKCQGIPLGTPVTFTAEVKQWHEGVNGHPFKILFLLWDG